MSNCGLPSEFCFIDLKKGGKVIGSICVIASGICSILLLVYLCSDFESIKKELSDDSEHVMTNLEDTRPGVQATAGISLALLILYLIASIFLIKGSHDKSKKLMIPYLIMTAIVIIFSVVIAFLQFEHEPFYAVLTISLVLFYFFLCVLSLYKNIRD